MANNYVQFSTTIDLVSEDEKRWWQRHLIDVNQACEIADVEDLDNAENLPAEVERFKRIAWIEDHDCYEFEHGFHEKNGSQWIWFHTDNGNVEHLAALAHYFFKDMRPTGDDVFVLLWACTCDEPRVEEFNGGTVVATKNGVGWCGVDKQLIVAKADIQKLRGLGWG